jgi:hypothetical protein
MNWNRKQKEYNEEGEKNGVEKYSVFIGISTTNSYSDQFSFLDFFTTFRYRETSIGLTPCKKILFLLYSNEKCDTRALTLDMNQRLKMSDFDEAPNFFTNEKQIVLQSKGGGEIACFLCPTLLHDIVYRVGRHKKLTARTLFELHNGPVDLRAASYSVRPMFLTFFL